VTASLVWETPNAETLIARMARVSNPANQDNPDYAGLLKYCIKNNHVSIFEMASVCIEIKCSRTIARQILRHRSFSFQEFSQRYAAVAETPIYTKARSQDAKNRQNSVDNMSEADVRIWEIFQKETWEFAQERYKTALSLGVAKELARSLLPEAMATTTMYMSGTIRSWVHFLEVRAYGPGVQLECREVALECAEILRDIIPSIFTAKGW